MPEYNGIDVSSWQGDIDWSLTKKSGVNFAMLRCGTGFNGGSKDKKFEQNYKNAKANGINVGTYFYSYALNTEQAKKEADFVLSCIKDKTFEYPIAFDIEDKTQSNLGKEKVSEIIKAFCERMEKSGYYVSVYASKSWLDSKISDDVKSKYDIWLAQWSNKPTYKGNFGIWQFSSKGIISGILGNVDMNVSYKDYPSIMKNNGLNGYKKTNATKPIQKTIKAGDVLTFKNKETFSSSTSKKPKKRTGTFYVYDGKQVNGRYRITNSLNRVNKKPTFLNVTCWAKL